MTSEEREQDVESAISVMVSRVSNYILLEPKVVGVPNTHVPAKCYSRHGLHQTTIPNIKFLLASAGLKLVTSKAYETHSRK